MHEFTNYTASVLLTDRAIRDPAAQVLLLVDNDKHNLELDPDEIRANLQIPEKAKRLKLPRIKMPTGGADSKAPTELYLNSVARGWGLADPFPEYQNMYRFPQEQLRFIAGIGKLRDRVTREDIFRATQAITDWRGGSKPSDEVLQIIAASEVAEESGILILWTELNRPIYEVHQTDNKRGSGTHMHRWYQCDKPLSVSPIAHPEIMTSGWVSVQDLIKVVEMQQSEHASYLYACPEFKRIKNTLWANTTCPYAEFIEGVVYGHGEAAMHAFTSDGAPKVVCRMRNAKTCV